MKNQLFVTAKSDQDADPDGFGPHGGEKLNPDPIETRVSDPDPH